MHGMKSRRGAARLGAGAAAVALAAASAVAVSTPAAAAEGAKKAPGVGASSAYGLNVNAKIAPAGQELLDASIGPLPEVHSEGERQQKEVLDVPAQPLFQLKVLKTVADGPEAEAKAVELRALQEALKVDLLVAKCTGDKGSAKLLNASLAGQPLETPEGSPISTQPAPNTTVAIPPEQVPQVEQLKQVASIKLTLNKQEKTDKGGIKVTALDLDVKLVDGTVTNATSISSVKCGPEGSQPEPSETDKVEDGDEAPKPKPVEGDLAVTG